MNRELSEIRSVHMNVLKGFILVVSIVRVSDPPYNTALYQKSMTIVSISLFLFLYTMQAQIIYLNLTSIDVIFRSRW